MRGQWIGHYGGDVDGKVMVNIDEVGDHYEAVAYINPYDKSIPSTVAYFDTIDRSDEVQVKAYLNPVNPTNGLQCKWEDVKQLFPDDVNHSNEAKVTLAFRENRLDINATTDIEVTFHANLDRPEDKMESSRTL